MRIRLPTALLAYGLEGPSASSTVDNLNPQGIHLRNPKTCPNKPSHFSWTVSLARRGGKDHRGLRIRVLVGECAALPALAPETFADWLVPLLGTIPMQQVFEYALEA
jgi:hypothetical protein